MSQYVRQWTVDSTAEWRGPFGEFTYTPNKVISTSVRVRSLVVICIPGVGGTVIKPSGAHEPLPVLIHPFTLSLSDTV